MNLDTWRKAAPALSAVWTMTAAILVGGFVGGWLDTRLGTPPAFQLGLAIAGLVVGSVRVVRGFQNAPHDPTEPPPP